MANQRFIQETDTLSPIRRSISNSGNFEVYFGPTPICRFQHDDRRNWQNNDGINFHFILSNNQMAGLNHQHYLRMKSPRSGPNTAPNERNRWALIPQRFPSPFRSHLLLAPKNPPIWAQRRLNRVRNHQDRWWKRQYMTGYHLLQMVSSNWLPYLQLAPQMDLFSPMVLQLALPVTPPAILNGKNSFSTDLPRVQMRMSLLIVDQEEEPPQIPSKIKPLHQVFNYYWAIIQYLSSEGCIVIPSKITAEIRFEITSWGR